MDNTLADKLPVAPRLWRDAEEVASYAQDCIAALDLRGWSFHWDRARKRLGCCRPDKKRISLSSHFVAYYLMRGEGEQQLIGRVILHELAHALAVVHHRARGHGVVWKHYCAQLGIAGEKASTRCDGFVQAIEAASPARKPRYALIIESTGELVRHYYAKPRRTARQWKQCYLPGRKKETLGQLRLIELG